MYMYQNSLINIIIMYMSVQEKKSHIRDISKNYYAMIIFPHGKGRCPIENLKKKLSMYFQRFAKF